jgi:hypothetical protein
LITHGRRLAGCALTLALFPPLVAGADLTRAAGLWRIRDDTIATGEPFDGLAY